MSSAGRTAPLQTKGVRHPKATSTPSLFDVLPQWYHPSDADMLKKKSKGAPPASPGMRNTNHQIELDEKKLSGDFTACTSPCKGNGELKDEKQAFRGSDHSVEKRFKVDGRDAKIYDPVTKKSYDYVVVKASFSPDPRTRNPFVFEYHNNGGK